MTFVLQIPNKYTVKEAITDIESEIKSLKEDGTNARLIADARSFLLFCIENIKVTGAGIEISSDGKDIQRERFTGSKFSFTERDNS